MLNLYRNQSRLKLGVKFMAVAAMSVLLGACSPRYLIVQKVADELASQNQASEDDVQLAREASAFYLKLSESVLRQTPDNLKLAEAVAAGFTQYAYAFVSFEAERVEANDVKAAQKLRNRAARLYLRAQRHAMNALEQHHPNFLPSLSSANPVKLEADEVGVAYWAAASWGGYISLSKDNPEAVADLPLAIRLAELAWQKNPAFANGALASLMGTFEVARPGGSAQKALRFFDQAITLGAGKNAGAFIAKAEGIALPAGDRPAFEALLNQALTASQAEQNLSNEVMRERALWLLDKANDLF